jgi:toxin ParE1/3/4
MRVRLTRAARNDLQQTANWIAQHNPEASLRLLETIRTILKMIGDHPEIGRTRDELAPRLRGLVAGSQLILYRQDPQAVTIVRILDGRRDLTKLFKD